MAVSAATFDVASKPPRAYVLTPEERQLFAPGAEVRLDGAASDLEDGRLSGGALVWSSDRQGVLGTGELLALADLLPGPHTLTLTATDGDGLSDSDSVRIFVGHRLRLPLFLK